MMIGLIVLYNWLLPGLIMMACACAGLAILIFLIKPYTLPMMNGYHIISEMLLILCFKIIYEIEQCNI